MIGKRRVLLAGMLAACWLAFSPAHAGNTPCSGKKGGISHCAGATFVCNDGSISASKRVCSMDRKSEMRPSNDDEGCSCRAHAYCTGPRGGRYCITDSGAKSYLRR